MGIDKRSNTTTSTINIGFGGAWGARLTTPGGPALGGFRIHADYASDNYFDWYNTATYETEAKHVHGSGYRVSLNYAALFSGSTHQHQIDFRVGGTWFVFPEFNIGPTYIHTASSKGEESLNVVAGRIGVHIPIPLDGRKNPDSPRLTIDLGFILGGEVETRKFTLLFDGGIGVYFPF